MWDPWALCSARAIMLPVTRRCRATLFISCGGAACHVFNPGLSLAPLLPLLRPSL